MTLLDNDHRLYADNRRTQIDMRVAKVFRFGNKRLDRPRRRREPPQHELRDRLRRYVSVQRQQHVDGCTWNNPTAIYTPRYARLNFTISF